MLYGIEWKMYFQGESALASSNTSTSSNTEFGGMLGRGMFTECYFSYQSSTTETLQEM